MAGEFLGVKRVRLNRKTPAHLAGDGGDGSSQSVGLVADRAVGAARRRRERRLRAQWRHEQQTVAMALAAATHHSAQRGEWRDLYEAPRGQRTASAEATYDALRSQTTSVAKDTEFFSLYEEELGGTRPDLLYEVRPQERDLRRTEHFPAAAAEHLVDIPVPRGGRILHPASSSSGFAGYGKSRGFRTFSRGKKSATLGPHSGSELGGDISSSMPAAQLEDFFMDAAGVWMRFPGGWWKLLGSDPEVWRPG